MATEKRLILYWDDVVTAIAKVFKGRMDDCIYSPSEVLSAAQGIRPADAVEVVHGRWIPTYHTYYNREGASQIADEWHCSECGIYSRSESNYCPNCGAKMDGDWNG